MQKLSAKYQQIKSHHTSKISYSMTESIYPRDERMVQHTQIKARYGGLYL
jgi:hypothetical protein